MDEREYTYAPGGERIISNNFNMFYQSYCTGFYSPIILPLVHTATVRRAVLISRMLPMSK
jgi:hypothetical protein